MPTETPVPTNTPVKIALSLPNAAKAAAGEKIAPPTPVPARPAKAAQTASVAGGDEIPLGLVLGGVVLLFAAITVGWTLGRRNRR